MLQKAHKMLIMGIWVTCAVLFAQGPVTDKIVVNFDQPVMVGEQQLAPGEYTIRQLPSASNPRILEFSSSDGTKVASTVSVFPIIDNNDIRETSVELANRGGRQYLSKIWIQGKTYGYGFSQDTSAQQEQAQDKTVRVAATYTPERPAEVAQAPKPDADAEAQRRAEAEREAERKRQAEEQARREQEERERAERARQEQQRAEEQARLEEQQRRDREQAERERQQVAQAQPQPEPAAQPEPQQPAAMPDTASSWLTYLLGGFALMATGLLLLRRSVF